MNKARRNSLTEIAEQISSIRDELEALRDEEDECRENMPESFQSGEKYELSESASSTMSEALDQLDEAISNINAAAE